MSDRKPSPVITARMVCDELVNKLWLLTGTPEGPWTLDYIGYTPCDPPTRIEYPSSESFPMWLKRRVAVLSMLDTNPHGSIVWGVGRRVDTHIYWVVEPIDSHGKDAGD